MIVRKYWLPSAAIFLALIGFVALTMGKRGVFLLVAFYALMAAIVVGGQGVKRVIQVMEAHLRRTYGTKRPSDPPRPSQHHDGFDKPT